MNDSTKCYHVNEGPLKYISARPLVLGSGGNIPADRVCLFCHVILSCNQGVKLYERKTRREALENIVTTGKVGGRKGRGRLGEMMLHGLRGIEECHRNNRVLGL